MNDEKYDYEAQMKEDLRDYIKEFVEWEGIKTREELEERRDDIYDRAFVSDSVTGNGSGSYFCNTWKSESALCHNLDLLGEAMAEFCCEPGELSKGAEWGDVTIRCYVLGQVFDSVMEEIGEGMEEMENAE